MSKNVNSTQFRTVDVDAYDEDAYQDDTSKEVSGLQEVSDRATEVKKLLQSQNTAEALAVALKNPPIACFDKDVKEQNYATVMSVLNAIRAGDIDEAIKKLSTSEVDVLMKYLYKGFSCSPNKAASLLIWHEKALARGGLGSIVRVMVDRRGV